MNLMTYEIRLRGELPADPTPGLESATRREIAGETVLITDAIDQQALFEMVARLRDLGIDLVELRRAAPLDSDPDLP